MNEQDYDRLLDASLHKLPREVEPPQELWAGIDHAINMPRGNKKLPFNKLFQVAAVLLIIIGSTWIFSGGLNSSNSDNNEISLTMLVEDMEEGFTMQKASLLSEYQGRPSLTSNWQDQLNELEIARNGIRSALKNNPNNVYMIQILQNIQLQQLDLIESVHTQINLNI